MKHCLVEVETCIQKVYCKVVFDMCHVDRSIVTLYNALVWHVFDCTYLCTHCRCVCYAVEAELPAFVILNRTLNCFPPFLPHTLSISPLGLVADFLSEW